MLGRLSSPSSFCCSCGRQCDDLRILRNRKSLADFICILCVVTAGHLQCLMVFKCNNSWNNVNVVASDVVGLLGRGAVECCIRLDMNQQQTRTQPQQHHRSRYNLPSFLECPIFCYELGCPICPMSNCASC